MPIIVDEVIISVEVGQGPAPQGSAPAAAPTDRQALVEECVERVLEVLRRREER